MAENNKKIERWIYQENVILTGGKVVCVFGLLDENDMPTGEEKYCDLRKKYVIGGIYEIPVDRQDGKCSISPADFTYKITHPDSDLRSRLRAEQIAAEQIAFDEKQADARFEKKARSEKLPDSWEELVQMHSKLNPDNGERFIAYVMRRLRADSRILKDLKRNR